MSPRIAVVTGALLTAVAGATPAVGAEILEGVIPLSSCEKPVFLATPHGSGAFAIAPTPGDRAGLASGTSATYWNFDADRTVRRDITGAALNFITPPDTDGRYWNLRAEDEHTLAIKNGFREEGDKRTVVRLFREDGDNSAAVRMTGSAPDATASTTTHYFDFAREDADREVTTPVDLPLTSPPPEGPRFLAAWRDRDDIPRLRVFGEPRGPKTLLVREGETWRGVLDYELETLEILPPDDFGPETTSMLVVSRIGRRYDAAGRLNLETGVIDYFYSEDDNRIAVDRQFSHDRRAFLWESRRAQGATGAGPITFGVGIAGADTVAPDRSARAYDMTFGSDDAEALYDSLRGEWSHVSVLSWAETDGSAAVIKLWGPLDRRRIEAVTIEAGRTAGERWLLCDTDQR